MKKKVITILIFLLFFQLTVYGCNSNWMYKQDNSTNSITPETQSLKTSTGDYFGNELNGTIILACTTEIVAVDVVTLEIRELLNVDDGYVIPDIAMNNGKLYFSMSTESYEGSDVVNRWGPNEIYMLNDRNDIEQITFNNYNDSSISTADTDLIVFRSDRIDTTSDRPIYNIVLLNTNTKSEKILFSSSKYVESKLSPLGNKIAIIEQTNQFGKSNQYQYQANLYFYNVDLVQQYQILNNEYIFYNEIEWAPDQSQFVVSGRKNDRNAIFYVNDENFEIKSVTFLDAIPQNFSWSPSGRYLLYEEKNLEVPDRDMKLYLLDLFTNENKLIFSGSIDGRYENYHAIWSPNGEYFSFMINDSENGSLMKMIIESPEYDSEVIVKEINVNTIWKAIWVNER